MSETTRPATAADVAVVVALAHEGREPLPEARGGKLWLTRDAIPEPLAAAVAHAVESADWLVQLSCIDAVTLGFLIAEAETIDEETIAVVRELYVTPQARGVGLGELMMDATVEWARAGGCVGIDGYALPGDRATKNFYETFGLVARGIVVHRSLDP